MAPDVRAAIQRIVQDESKVDENAAFAYVEGMRQAGAKMRYHEDVWAGNA